MLLKTYFSYFSVSIFCCFYLSIIRGEFLITFDSTTAVSADEHKKQQHMIKLMKYDALL